MLLTLIVTRKIAILRFVTQRVWAELAAWRSAASGLGKGWKTRVDRHGWRQITPWVSWAATVHLGENRRRDD